MRVTFLAPLVVAVGLAAAAAGQEMPAHEAAPAVIEVQAPDVLFGARPVIAVWTADRESASAAISAAFDELRRIHKRLDRHAETSDIGIINRNAARDSVVASREVVGLLQRAVRLAAASGGAYDFTKAPVLDVWSFESGDKLLPEGEAVGARLGAVHYELVVLDLAKSTVYFRRPGVGIELGRLGLGYVLDRAASTLRSRGVTSFLIGAGDVQIGSGRKGTQPWKVEISHPRRAGGAPYAALFLAGEAAATVGDYVDAFVHDGVRYHPVLHPRTGFPARRAVAVTAVGRDAATTAAAAEAAFIMGPAEGIQFLESQGLDGVIIAPDGQLHMTNGMKPRLLVYDAVPLTIPAEVGAAGAGARRDAPSGAAPAAPRGGH